MNIAREADAFAGEQRAEHEPRGRQGSARRTDREGADRIDARDRDHLLLAVLLFASPCLAAPVEQVVDYDGAEIYAENDPSKTMLQPHEASLLLAATSPRE